MAITLTLSSKNYSSWSLRGWLMARFAGLRRPGGGLGRDDELVRFTVAEEGSQLACWCGWSIGFLAVLWALREGYDRTSALATAGPLQLPWDHDNRGPALARRAPEYIRRWKADEVFHRAAVSVWHLCSGDREINTPAFLAALEEL